MQCPDLHLDQQLTWLLKYVIIDLGFGNVTGNDAEAKVLVVEWIGMKRTYKVITIHDVEEAGGSVSSVPNELKDKIDIVIEIYWYP